MTPTVLSVPLAQFVAQTLDQSQAVVAANGAVNCGAAHNDCVTHTGTESTGCDDD